MEYVRIYEVLNWIKTFEQRWHDDPQDRGSEESFVYRSTVDQLALKHKTADLAQLESVVQDILDNVYVRVVVDYRGDHKLDYTYVLQKEYS